MGPVAKETSARSRSKLVEWGWDTYTQQKYLAEGEKAESPWYKLSVSTSTLERLRASPSETIYL